MNAERIWKAMPWVDSHTGNWSLTRSLAMYIGYCICQYINKVAKLDLPAVAIVALVFLAAFSKNVEDFRKGAATILQNRKSESLPAVTNEPEPRP